MLERDFDIAFIAGQALREKQIQQNYRPIIAVHKWFARRPGTLFRAILLSEFADGPLRDIFFNDHDLTGRRIADPFMGGGTPLLEANRTGCSVLGYDINPMAWWIVNEELLDLDGNAYTQAAESLRAALEREIGPLYRTRCVVSGKAGVPVKSFLWVKTLPCRCGTTIDLFPGMLLAENDRHPKQVLVCSTCGELNEVDDKNSPGSCGSCSKPLRLEGNVRRGSAICPGCGANHRVPARPQKAPLDHRLFAIEYTNPALKDFHRGRFFKKPDEFDLARVEEARKKLARMTTRFIPDDEIPTGDETDRLHRWGYRFYREMFHPRQLLGLELSARLIADLKDTRIKRALATNLSDLLRYQNQLCRYDTRALKVLDIFSVHGFPVGLVHAEANILGIVNGNNAPVGSGGWANIIEKYRRAKAYCEQPFEIRHDGKRKVIVPLKHECIGSHGRNGTSHLKRVIDLKCASAVEFTAAPDSLDAVLTDPPYLGNVQYAELIDFCYVWLRKLAGSELPAFARDTTRHLQELTANETLGRGIESFTDGLSKIFRQSAKALKPGSPLAFTFHHNSPDAYLPIAVAILDAGLVCSASLPAPAEMGASIHISGTGSSIIDTVFVCRTTGRTKRSTLAESAQDLAAIVRNDLALLKEGGVKPTRGDARCVGLGHLTRMAIWLSRADWDKFLPTPKRLAAVREKVQTFGGIEAVLAALDAEGDPNEPLSLRLAVNESDRANYNVTEAYASF